MLVELYLVSNLNCLQSANNVLDISVQEVLPAVQNCYFQMTSWKWWAMVTVLWLSGFCGIYGCKSVSEWKVKVSRICVVFLALRTCNPKSRNSCICLPCRLWYIACRSWSDWNDAPTGLLFSSCFAHRASSQLSCRNLPGRFEIVAWTFSEGLKSKGEARPQTMCL